MIEQWNFGIKNDGKRVEAWQVLAGVPVTATGVPAVSGFAMLKILMECIGRVRLFGGEHKSFTCAPTTTLSPQ